MSTNKVENAIEISKITPFITELLLRNMENLMNKKVDNKQCNKITNKANAILKLASTDIDAAKQSLEELKKEVI